MRAVDLRVTRWLVGGLAVFLLAAAAGCTSDDPAPIATDRAPTASPVRSIEGPIYETYATVLQMGGEGPELCLGGIMTSYPPKCGGPPIVNWDWDRVLGEERAANVIWGDYHVLGRYDGHRFEATAVTNESPSVEWLEPEQQAPPTRALLFRRLRRIQSYLSGARAPKRFGYRWLWSDVLVEEGVVEIGVVVATRRTRRGVVRAYGRGVVRLTPGLRRVHTG